MKATKRVREGINKSKASTNPDRKLPKGAKVGIKRTKSTIKRLQLYRSRPVRDEHGKLIRGDFMSRELPTNTRIAPDRRWFENTRLIGQKELEKFREHLTVAVNNPYSMLLHQNKIPFSLITDPKAKPVNMLSAESFESTFGPKTQRKRPKINVTSFEELVNSANTLDEKYTEDKDSNKITNVIEPKDAVRQSVYEKGTSKRIWGELYKVIDSSDVVIQVLDARDPMGTRSKHIEKHMSTEKKHKQLIFVLNKCDLVPTWVTARWVKVLSKERPTLAFHASITNPFGKGSLIQLLRQLGGVHQDKKQISVGFIGYPNVGKSSIINALRSKKVCKVAPIPGETKVWQYITLFRRIFLIDCPGVVYPSADSDSEIVLKGVVRVENINDPEQHIPLLLQRIRREYISRTYKITSWKDTDDFLEQVAQRTGKLQKQGEANTHVVAKMILNDFQRGKIPFFVPPPFDDDHKNQQNTELADSVPTVIQNFKNIQLRTKFDDIDTTVPEGFEFDPIPSNEKFIDYDKMYRGELAEEEENLPALALNKNSTNSNFSESNSDHEDEDDQENDEDEDEDENDQRDQKIAEKNKKSLNQKGKQKNFNKREILKKKNTRNAKRNDEIDFEALNEKRKKIKKEARMATNKRKVGFHFYDSVNVKNKNRNRIKPRK
eukprot:TRINITY_DN424_c0_g3_i1.p1 TRINITY_DN424_c0_g3~~TRINITY_DN424_c0_g3_i1.p1  ORF type:complete len:662 (-),score=303.09 TRINITY_DN424_c0_g3_i1:116-2101(-)